MKKRPTLYLLCATLLFGLVAAFAISIQTPGQVLAQDFKNSDKGQSRPKTTSVPGPQMVPYTVMAPHTDGNGRVGYRTETRYRQQGFSGNTLPYPMSSYATEHGREIQEVLGEFVQASEEEKEGISERLKVILGKEFDSMHDDQAKEIASMEERLKNVQAKHEQRVGNKDKIVERRFNDLIGRNDPLAWNPNSNQVFTPNPQFHTPYSVPPQQPNLPANGNFYPSQPYQGQTQSGNFQQWTGPGNDYPNIPGQQTRPDTRSSREPVEAQSDPQVREAE